MSMEPQNPTTHKWLKNVHTQLGVHIGLISNHLHTPPTIGGTVHVTA